MRGQELAYRPDIDGLRAVALLIVVFFHAFPGLVPGGFVGVDVFFVISGYLITGLIVERLEAANFTFWNFYARRIRRIFPALILVLSATVALGWWILLPDEYQQLGKHVLGGATFLSNLLLWSEVGYFDTAAERKPLLHLWSLGVEEQLYLFWPIALVFIWRLRRYRLLAVAAIAFASFLLGIYLLDRYPGAAFYLPFSRLWEFLAGALVCLKQRGPGASIREGSWHHGTLASNAFSLSGVTLIILAVVVLDRESAFPGWLAFMPALGGAFVIAGGSDAWLNRCVLAARPLVFLGLTSYAMYLWHWPLISYLRILEIDDPVWNRLLRIGAILVALVLSAATYVLVERPLRVRHDLRAVVLILSAGMAVTAICGTLVILHRGFPAASEKIADPFSWPAGLVRTPLCVEKYGQPLSLAARTYCVEKSSLHEATILLIGDSHANALLPGVSSTERETNVLMLGGSGCPPIRSPDYWEMTRPRERANCEPLMDSAYRAVRATSPDMVVLAARFDAYAHDENNLREETWLTYLGTPRPSWPPIATFENALREDLSDLLQRARRVVVVLQVPELDFDPHNCVAVRSIDSLRKRNKDCRVARKDVLEKQDLYRKAIDRVVRGIASSKLYVVDPLEALCDDQWCYGLRDGVLLYRNSHHLSRDGATYVWRSLNLGGTSEAR